MILLFGPPGAGKSMQGQMLAARQGWKWLSTGEMLRRSNDPAVIDILRSGELASNELIYQMFEQAVQNAILTIGQTGTILSLPDSKGDLKV